MKNTFIQDALVIHDYQFEIYSSMCRLIKSITDGGENTCICGQEQHSIVGSCGWLYNKIKDCHNNVTLEQSEELNRRENMFCCYRDQLISIMSTEGDNERIWSSPSHGDGQRETPYNQCETGESTTILTTIIPLSENTLGSVFDLIDKNKTITVTIDVLSIEDKDGNQLKKLNNKDSNINMYITINSLTIKSHYYMMEDDREEEKKNSLVVDYTDTDGEIDNTIRNSITGVYSEVGENIKVSERNIDDKLLSKIINYNEHKMKDISMDKTLHPYRLYGEDHIVRRGVVTDKIGV